MPCFRGIDLSIATHSATRVLPEFPHPDGYSGRLPSLQSLQINSADSPQCQSTGDGFRLSSSGRGKGTPTISVYVPSLPGVQFWLRYRAVNVSPQAAQLYFKMFMNGRLVTAWGADPKTTPQGNIMRALYEPSKSWHYMENGVTYKSEGIKSRYFHFTPGPEKSVAEDGGSIEIRVWRSQGRQRRAPNMEPFRSQEKYGIASPSGGLIDNPQSASFFTYNLLDPVDCPYATFKFHYRSWNNLVQFNLIPSNSSLALYRPASTASEFSVDSTQEELSDGYEVALSALLGRKSAEDFNFGLMSLDGTVFKDNEIKDVAAVQRRASTKHTATRAGAAEYWLRTPPKLRPMSILGIEHPQPSKAARDGLNEPYLHRPLPELPPNPSPDECNPARTRRLSSASRAPSITPSLLQHMDDDDSDVDDEEVVVGVAKLVTIPESSSRASLTCDKGSTQRSSGGSSSDYETSPPSSNASRRSCANQISPQVYDITTGSTLESNLNNYSPAVKRASPTNISPKARRVLGAVDMGDVDLPNAGAVKVSESQWMKGIPLPLHRRFGWHTIGGKAGHSEVGLGVSLFSGFRKHKARPGSVDIAGIRRIALNNSSSCVAQEVKDRPGNWI